MHGAHTEAATALGKDRRRRGRQQAAQKREEKGAHVGLPRLTKLNSI